MNIQNETYFKIQFKRAHTALAEKMNEINKLLPNRLPGSATYMEDMMTDLMLMHRICAQYNSALDTEQLFVDAGVDIPGNLGHIT